MAFLLLKLIIIIIINQTNDIKDVIFLNITFDNTIFDKLFSLYFYKTLQNK